MSEQGQDQKPKVEGKKLGGRIPPGPHEERIRDGSGRARGTHIGHRARKVRGKIHQLSQ